MLCQFVLIKTLFHTNYLNFGIHDKSFDLYEKVIPNQAILARFSQGFVSMISWIIFGDTRLRKTNSNSIILKQNLAVTKHC